MKILKINPFEKYLRETRFITYSLFGSEFREVRFSSRPNHTQFGFSFKGIMEEL